MACLNLRATIRNPENCISSVKSKCYEVGNFYDVISIFLPIWMRLAERNCTPVLGHEGREGECDSDDPVGHGYNASPIVRKIPYIHISALIEK